MRIFVSFVVLSALTLTACSPRQAAIERGKINVVAQTTTKTQCQKGFRCFCQTSDTCLEKGCGAIFANGRKSTKATVCPLIYHTGNFTCLNKSGNYKPHSIAKTCTITTNFGSQGGSCLACNNGDKMVELPSQ